MSLGSQGEILTIPDVKHKDAGTYRCLADNGINPPAHGVITVDVERKCCMSSIISHIKTTVTFFKLDVSSLLQNFFDRKTSEKFILKSNHLKSAS